MTIILGIKLNGLILLAGIAWICASGWLGKPYALQQALGASHG